MESVKKTTLLFRGIQITNMILKSELNERYDDQICFTYPKEKAKSQMFFSTNLQASDITGTVRKTDSIIICAKTSRHECEMFDFSLEISLKDANDLIQSYQLHKNNRPVEWQNFFKTLLKQSQISTKKQIVCDMISQIVFSLILGDTKMAPLTIGLTQLIHNTCRSKHLITVFNRLALCTGYDSMQRIDTSLTQRIINQAVGHRVPVSSEITSANIIMTTTLVMTQY